MCYQLIERYSSCRCLYYQHAIDRCAAYGRVGHTIQQRTILVGYACADHTAHSSGYDEYGYSQYSDSGYHSHGHHSHGQRSHKSSHSSRYR
ncbi:hypothetical protein QBC36DRAFT_182944 [Triangularia setosa]|uniref:Uncharacterized protein n=1 Tax=Triangularia setosa TaxID=2587417 RepID=A0AAN6WAM1_9PEZI|nr:hypothetical protein QBC36DRAFT_182944 [Podospora setosa]